MYIIIIIIICLKKFTYNILQNQNYFNLCFSLILILIILLLKKYKLYSYIIVIIYTSENTCMIRMRLIF